MNEFKYQITQLLFLGLLAFGSYWALTQLDTGTTYTRENIVADQSTTSESPAVVPTQNQEGSVVTSLPGGSGSTLPVDTPEPSVDQPESTLDTNDDLIRRLSVIADSGVIIAKGAQGDRVKTIQEFLRVYFNDSGISLDGDYGPGTERLVREFQRAELGGGDGRVGPNTLKKVLETLE